ncbi:VWA domain-containing protein [Lentzea sp. NPDC005914]|uniref:VWA domain-containing protein n=1 Tax=Lentzea sp. NPDC005914 TaxID=3154572 RepID=UPI0033C58A9A
MDEFRLSVNATNELSPTASDAIEGAHGKLKPPADTKPEYTVHLGKAKGVIVGDNARQWNTFWELPKNVRRLLIVLLVAILVAGTGFVVFRWVIPMFAPIYKTTFLIDAAEGDLASVTGALTTVVGNSGEHDSQSLRSFGGECGTDENTTQLVGFGTGNRQEIADAAKSVRQGTKATLQRGIVEAVNDFTPPLSLKAKQVNRIIVVTRHGKDACDPDDEFVQAQIRDRVAAAGLTIEFRFIGYQVRDEDDERLNELTRQLKTQEPTYTSTPEDLKRVLAWFTTIEPVLRSSQSVVNVLNPTVDKLNSATEALKSGRFDLADSALAEARAAVVDIEIKDLDGRTTSDEAVRLRDRAVRLRTLQAAVIEAADTLADQARSGRNLTEPLAVYTKAANAYNAEAREMTEALTSLRAKSPGGTG